MPEVTQLVNAYLEFNLNSPQASLLHWCSSHLNSSLSYSSRVGTNPELVSLMKDTLLSPTALYFSEMQMRWGGHWWGEAQGVCSLAWHLFLCHCSAVPWEPSTISDVLDGIARFSFLVQRTWEVSRQVLCDPFSRISLGGTASPNPLLPSFCLSTKVVRGSRTVRIQLKNQMCRFNSSLNSI